MLLSFCHCERCLESAVRFQFPSILLVRLIWLLSWCVISSIFYHGKPCAAHQTEGSKLAQLADQFHIVIETEDESFPVQSSSGLIEASNPNSSDLKTYLPIFLDEFAQYPPEVILRSGLKKIVLCRDLKVADQATAGLADHDNEILYLDTGIGKDFPAKLLCLVIHHEFFHIIDSKENHTYTDSSWSALNEPDFKYGSGWQSAKKTATMFMLNYALVGFLNRYSMSAVEEDKAEMFANMMVDYRRVKERIELDDPILEAKFLRIKEFLRKFCPSFNDAFWAKVSMKVIR